MEKIHEGVHMCIGAIVRAKVTSEVRQKPLL